MASSSQQWFVYMLRCRSGALYTGITTDVQKRYAAHCAGRGARYTRMNPPEALVAMQLVANKSAALRLERQLKRLSLRFKSAWVLAHAVDCADFVSESVTTIRKQQK